MNLALTRSVVCHRSELPGTLDWLSEAEAEQLDSLSSAPRRASWLLGRFTVKRALHPLFAKAGQAARSSEIEVRALSSGAPRAFVRGAPAPFSVSISHRDEVAFVAVAPAGVALGCDVELVEPRSRAFVADFFTAREAALVESHTGADRDALACLVWSAKESALKVLGEGLRRDTRSVEISGARAPSSEWAPFTAHLEEGGTLAGRHRREGPLVFTVAQSAPERR